MQPQREYPIVDLASAYHVKAKALSAIQWKLISKEEFDRVIYQADKIINGSKEMAMTTDTEPHIHHHHAASHHLAAAHHHREAAFHHKHGRHAIAQEHAKTAAYHAELAHNHTGYAHKDSAHT